MQDIRASAEKQVDELLGPHRARIRDSYLDGTWEEFSGNCLWYAGQHHEELRADALKLRKLVVLGKLPPDGRVRDHMDEVDVSAFLDGLVSDGVYAIVSDDPMLQMRLRLVRLREEADVRLE